MHCCQMNSLVIHSFHVEFEKSFLPGSLSLGMERASFPIHVCCGQITFDVVVVVTKKVIT